MDLRTLRCFSAVVREGHFGRAAVSLGMAQPPLTRQIQKLERELGVALLHRTQKKFEVTPAGQLLYERARRLLDGADQAEADVRRLGTGETGRLIIGFVHSNAFTILPGVVARFRAAFPNVEMDLREMWHATLVTSLETGAVDVGLLRPPVEHGELIAVPCSQEALVIALPEAVADSWPQRPSLRDCEGQPLLMYSPYEARYFHQMVSSLLERAEVLPDIVEYVSQIHSMLALVRAGIGVALIPAAAAMLHFEGVVYRPVRTTPAKPVELWMAYRKDNDNPVFNLLKTVLHNTLAEGR